MSSREGVQTDHLVYDCLRRSIFPGDLPASPETAFTKPADGQTGPDIRFVRFRPPRLERTQEGLTLSLPHIRLDRALQFLIGDRLA